MASKQVGEVHLQVFPRFDRFHSELQSKLNSKQKSQKPYEVPIDGDLDKFEEKLKIIEGWRKEQEKNPIKIAVDLETADAIRELREFRKTVDSLDDVEIDVSVDVDREELHHLAGEFNDLRYDMDSGLSTYVDVDSSELDKLRAELKALQTQMAAEPLVQRVLYDGNYGSKKAEESAYNTGRKMGQKLAAGLDERYNSITFVPKMLGWASAQFDIGYRLIYDKYLKWGDLFAKAVIKPFSMMKSDWKAAGDLGAYFDTLAERIGGVAKKGDAFLSFLAKMKGDAKTTGDAIKNNLTRNFEGFVQSARGLRTSLHYFRVPDDVFKSWLELRAKMEIVKLDMQKPFKDVWAKARAGAEGFQKALSSLGVTFRATRKDANDSSSAYNRFFNALYSAQGKLLDLIGTTKDTADNFARLFGAENFKSSALGKQIDGLSGHLKKLGSDAKLTGAIIRDSIGGAFDKVKSSTWGVGITRLLTESKLDPAGLRQFGKKISDKISQAMVKATGDADGGSASLGKALSNMLGEGFKKMKNFAKPLTDGFSNAFDNIARMTRGFGGKISGSLAGVMTGVRNMSSNFTSALDGSMSGVGRGLVAAFTPALSSLKTRVFQPISDGITNSFSRGFRGAGRVMDTATRGWAGRMARTMAPITRTIGSTFSRAFSGLGRIAGRAMSGVGSIMTRALASPMLKKGMNAVFSRVGQYASGASRMAIGAFSQLGGFLMKSLMPIIMSIGVSLMAVFGQVLIAQVLALGGAIGSVAAGAALFAPALAAGLGASLAVLKVGLSGVKESVSAAFSADSAEEFEQAIADMNPKVQEIARAFRQFKPAIDEMKEGIQTNLLDGLAPGIESAMNNLLPIVSEGSKLIATTWNHSFQDVLTELSSEQAQYGMASIMANTAKMGDNMRPVLANLTAAFGSLAEQGSKFLPEFGTWAADISQSFRDWVESLKQINPETGLSKFDETVEKAKVNAGYLKDIFGGLFGTLGNVFSAAEASGGGLLKAMGDNMQHLKEITEEGTKGYTEITKFMGSASEMMTQVGTLMGPILGVLSNVGQILTQFGSAVIPGLVPVLEGLEKGLEPILGVAKEVGTVLGDALKGFGPLIEKLGQALAPLLEGLANGIAPMLTGLTDALQPVFDLLPGLMESFAPVLETVGEGLGKIFEALGPIIEQIVKSLDAVMPLLDNVMGVIGDVFAAILEAIQPLFESGIIEQLVEALMPLVDVIGDALLNIVDALAPLMPIIADAFFRLVEALIPIIPALAEIVLALLPPMLQAVEALIPILEPVIDLIISIVEAVLPPLIDIVKMVADVYAVAWSAIAGAIEVAVAIITPIIDGLRLLIEGIGGVFNWLWEGVVQPVWDGITRIIQGFVDFFKAIIHGDIVGAVKSLGDIIGGIKDIFGAVKDFVQDAFKNAGSWLIDAGKSIVDGLLNGIGNIGEAIGKWILDKVPGPIKGAVKKALGLEDGGVVPALVVGGVVPALAAGGRPKDAPGGRLPTTGPGTDTTDGILGVNDDGIPTARVDAGEWVINRESSEKYDRILRQINAGTYNVPGYAAGGAVGKKNPLMDLVSQATTGASALAGQVSGAASAIGGAIGAGADAATAFGADLFSGITESWTVVSETMSVAWVSFQTEASSVFGTIQTMVDTTWSSISDLTAASWDATSLYLDTTWGNMLSTATSIWTSTQQTISNAWGVAGQSIVDGWNNHFAPTFSTLQNGLTTLQGWFNTTVDNIGSAWDRLRPKTGAPAKFVVETVFNNGIRNAWNAVAALIDEKDVGPVSLGNLGGYATGGVLPGYTPGTDVHRFTSRTGGTIDLSGGEAIMRPEWTRAVGGPAAVEKMNKEARMGRLSAPHQAHASGGIVALPSQNFVSGGTVATADTITPIQRAMWDVIRSAFPGAILTSATRGADVGSGYDFHMQGKAIDLGGPMAQMNQWIAKKYGSSILEMFYDPGINIDEGRPMGPIGGHGDHVHWAMDSILDPSGIKVVSTEGGSAGGGGFSMAAAVSQAWDDEINKIPDYKGPKGRFGDAAPKLQESMISSAWDYVSEKAAATLSAGLVSTAGIANGPNREMGKEMAARVGWTGDKWNALDQLWQHESGWDNNAQNPSSEAYGIPQFLNATWASVGVPKTSDPKKQIQAGIRYIQQRPDYQGDPRLAWQLWNSRSPHWYDQGGIATGKGNMQKNVLEPERVLSPRQTRAFEDFVFGFMPELIDDFRKQPFSIEEGVDRIVKKLGQLPGEMAVERGKNIDRLTDGITEKFKRQIDGKGSLNPIDTNYDAGWIDRNGNKLQANISAAIADGSDAASDPWGYLAAEQAAKDRIDAEAEEAEKKRAEAEKEKSDEEKAKADEERKAERDKKLEEAGDDEELKKTLKEGFDKEDKEAKEKQAEADKVQQEKDKAEADRIKDLKASGEYYYGYKVFGDDGKNPNEYERSENENMAWEGGTQFANALGLEGGDKLSKRVSMLQSFGSAVNTATPAWIAAANGDTSGLSHNIAVGTASALDDARSGAKDIAPGLVASALEGVLSTASLNTAPLVGTINTGMSEDQVFQVLDRYETRSARKRGGTPRRL
jgi:phage-related protein